MTAWFVIKSEAMQFHHNEAVKRITCGSIGVRDNMVTCFDNERAAIYKICLTDVYSCGAVEDSQDGRW